MNNQKLETKMIKATEHHINNIDTLIKFKKKNKEPTEKQLKKMYSYLDTCLYCGEEFTFLEPYAHGFEGNIHKFGCSWYSRVFGVLFNIVWIPIKLVLFLIFTPIYLVSLLIEKIRSVIWI